MNNERCKKKEISEIIMPYGCDKIKKLITSARSIAYYTTAETAYKIIKNHEFWMRNVTVMNDYSEIRYGSNVIKDNIENCIGEELRSFVCDVYGSTRYSSFNLKVQNFLNLESTSWIYNTYIVCFTEHDPIKDRMGRLSMWRAYGGKNGVAIVLRKEKLEEFINVNDLDYTPVAYLNKKEVFEELKKIINNLKGNKDLLKSVGYDCFENKFIKALRYAIIAIKHPGFEEENEWRVFTHGDNLNLKYEIESLGGVVQPIIKIGNENKDREKIFIKNLIDHIIIGPTDIFSKSNVTHKAFVRLISDEFRLPLNEAEKRVKDSDIPYRNL